MKLVNFTCVIITVCFSFIGSAQSKSAKEDANFDYVVEQFADIRVLRYQIAGWDKLTLKEKQLVYYLTQAGNSGRDIMWDQHYKYNLKIRKALENIYLTYKGEKTVDNWKNFQIYLKRVWFFQRNPPPLRQR